jgi:hypothetical protein
MSSKSPYPSVHDLMEAAEKAFIKRGVTSQDRATRKCLATSRDFQNNVRTIVTAVRAALIASQKSKS